MCRHQWQVFYHNCGHYEQSLLPSANPNCGRLFYNNDYRMDWCPKCLRGSLYWYVTQNPRMRPFWSVVYPSKGAFFPSTAVSKCYTAPINYPEQAVPVVIQLDERQQNSSSYLGDSELWRRREAYLDACNTRTRTLIRRAFSVREKEQNYLNMLLSPQDPRRRELYWMSATGRLAAAAAAAGNPCEKFFTEVQAQDVPVGEICPMCRCEMIGSLEDNTTSSGDRCQSSVFVHLPCGHHGGLECLQEWFNPGRQELLDVRGVVERQDCCLICQAEFDITREPSYWKPQLYDKHWMFRFTLNTRERLARHVLYYGGSVLSYIVLTSTLNMAISPCVFGSVPTFVHNIRNLGLFLYLYFMPANYVIDISSLAFGAKEAYFRLRRWRLVPSVSQIFRDTINWDHPQICDLDAIDDPEYGMGTIGYWLNLLYLSHVLNFLVHTSIYILRMTSSALQYSHLWTTLYSNIVINVGFLHSFIDSPLWQSSLECVKSSSVYILGQLVQPSGASLGKLKCLSRLPLFALSSSWTFSEEARYWRGFWLDVIWWTVNVYILLQYGAANSPPSLGYQARLRQHVRQNFDIHQASEDEEREMRRRRREDAQGRAGVGVVVLDWSAPESWTAEEIAIYRQELEILPRPSQNR